VALARSIFGDAIDYPQVRIRRRKWFPFQPRRVTMAPRGHIHFHPRGTAYCDDFAQAPLAAQGLFIHELTHVWQHQQGIFLPLRRHPFSSYRYRLEPGRAFARYGIEQQAEIVRHAFLARNGAPGTADAEALDALLPFG
jgi:hypothetical protein